MIFENTFCTIVLNTIQYFNFQIPFSKQVQLIFQIPTQKQRLLNISIKTPYIVGFIIVCQIILGGGGIFAVVTQQSDPKEFQFISYGKIPTWVGVAADWHTPKPTLHLFDPKKYVGHSTYVARVLNGCKTFEEFKTLVSTPAKRRYVPFFIYDLRQTPITTTEKKSYNWALLVQDYRYSDTDAEIEKMLLRMADLIGSQVAGMSPQGIMILAKNEHNKINTRLAPLLIAKGHSVLTLDGLRIKMGGDRQEILNEGEATGTLRLVNSPEEARKLTPRDIAVYTYTPLEVPPVAGIITLQPQTQLSHTAILAKNRGTVNVYAATLDGLNNAEKCLDKEVVLRAYGREISIRPLSSAGKIPPPPLPSKSMKTIVLPTASPASGYEVRAFENTPDSLLTVENIGTKAANYAQLMRVLGHDWVRPGYAIGYKPYFDVIAQEAQPYIEQFLAEKKAISAADRSTVSQYLDNIRQCILESKVPPQTLQSVRQLIQQKYPYSRIRVRSSTNCEDLPQFNGAGLYDSEGINAWDSDKKISKAILKVYASLWNERAFWEREYFGINHRKTAMALHINEAFDNDNEWANGVLLAQQGAEGQWEILVNIQADNVLVTNPSGGETPESFYIVGADGRMGAINYRSNRGDVLLGEQPADYKQQLIRQIAQNTCKAYAYFVGKRKDYGLDMEFKIVCTENDSLHLYFKQARLLKVAADGKPAALKTHL